PKDGRSVKIVGPGKGRIGGHAKLSCFAAKAHAQDIEQQFLAALQPPRRTGPAALPDPGPRRHFRRHLEHGVAYLWEQVHVLMAVDEVGWPAERGDEGLHLRGNLARHALAVESARDRRAHRSLER